MITQEIYKSLCNEFNSASFSAKQNSRDTVRPYKAQTVDGIFKELGLSSVAGKRAV